MNTVSHLEIRDLALRYGAKLALDGVALACAAGSFTVILGPSGCGKSSLLRVIAGLETPDTGAIYLQGHPVTARPTWRRGVAMVFQSYALYPHLNVFDNLAFPLRAARRPRTEVTERVNRIAHRLGLAEELRRKPATLSGGQRQRVALGRALIREPLVLLLDEPLSNLDAALRTEMREEIRRLHRETKTTIVYVTHDQEEAMELAETLVVMRRGQIAQSGPPGTIYDQPATAFVAQFVGSPAMNLMPWNELLQFAEGASQPGMNAWRDSIPGPVNAGVRPEAFNLEPNAPDDWRFEGRVRLARRRGRDLAIELEGPESSLLRVILAPTGPIEAGARLRLHLPRGAVHLFDPANGQRLDTPLGSQ